jgi:HD superfamily phosphohydrolase YqeK
MSLQTLELIASVLWLVQTSIPVLQMVAKKTANTFDDTALASAAKIIHDLLAILPAQRFGATLEEKEILKDAKAVTDATIVDDILHK